MEIILASASPRRRELLKVIFSEFVSVSPEVEEIIPDNIEIRDGATYLAELKADSLTDEYRESVIIACDTCVIVNEMILGKPSNEEEARYMLNMLSGKMHEVITGCCIKYKDIKRVFSETTIVKFNELTSEDIDNYIDLKESFDKAGGYGIQGRGSLLVEKIEGDFYNVVGLPISRLAKELKYVIIDKN